VNQHLFSLVSYCPCCFGLFGYWYQQVVRDVISVVLYRALQYIICMLRTRVLIMTESKFRKSPVAWSSLANLTLIFWVLVVAYVFHTSLCKSTLTGFALYRSYLIFCSCSLHECIYLIPFINMNLCTYSLWLISVRICYNKWIPMMVSIRKSCR